MARVLVDCHTCACLIQVEDPTCPFCGAAQRRVGAPRWLAASLVCGLGLTTIACDDSEDAAWLLRDLPGTSSGGTTTATTGTTGTTGTTTGTTLDDTTMTPDASTYSGPDETDTISPWSTSDGTSTSSSSSGTTTAASSADASTYAGPDESTFIPTTDPPDTSDDTTAPTGGAATGADATGSTGPSGQQSGDDAGCGCASQTAPGSGLLGLLALGATRRRRVRPR